MKETNKPLLWSSTVLAATGSGAAMAQDASAFQGFYGGLTYGFSSGEENDAGYTVGDGNNLGFFAGYTHAFGSFTLGGEVHYTTGRFDVDTDLGIDNGYEANDLVDLKARAGMVFNSNIHAYGFVGYSQVHTSEYNADENEHSGLNYGVGVEYQVMDRVNLGLEYIQRDFGDDDDGAYTDTRAISTIALRVGFQF